MGTAAHRIPADGRSRRDSPGLVLLGALGAGAALMYFLDPDKGRRRRALLRDRAVHAQRLWREAKRVSARDMANRAQGLRAVATRLLRHRRASDAELAERVRARLGRVVSHPHAVRVEVHDGCAVLSGPILAREVPALLATVEKVAGLRRIENRLQAYEEAGNVPALQGGVPRHGDRFELLQDNWSPAARVTAGTLGGALLTLGAGSGGIFSLAARMAGAGLVLRAGVNLPLATLLGLGSASRGIQVQKSMNVDAPVEQVFHFWSNYRNFPLFMRHVREVRPLDPGRSLWIVDGPAGVPVEWISEVVRVVPDREVQWRSQPGSMVRHAGVVRFDPNGQGGTRVHIRLWYVPPAGAVGHAVAAMFAADPKHEMDDDLMRMKSMIETGHPPHDAAARRAPGHALAGQPA